MSVLQDAVLHILDRLEDPIFLVDRTGLLLYSNPAGTQVVEANAGFVIRSGRLGFDAAGPGEWLVHSLRTVGSSPSADETCITRVRVRREWLIVVTALSRELHAGCLAIHCIGRLYPRRLPGPILMKGFGLSPRETQVLTLLTTGRSLRQAADALSLAHETIRSNLKQIFRKCNVTSQGELLALMQKLALTTSRLPRQLAGRRG